MRKAFVFFLFFCFSAVLGAQTGFFLQSNKKKDKIPFKLVNNLPIIQIEINGTPLSFILDTGVKSTILFSLEEADSLQLRNTTPVMLQGLGAGGAVEALRSLNNKATPAIRINIIRTILNRFSILTTGAVEGKPKR